jgi:hypothetical protein
VFGLVCPGCVDGTGRSSIITKWTSERLIFDKEPRSAGHWSGVWCMYGSAAQRSAEMWIA